MMCSAKRLQRAPFMASGSTWCRGCDFVYCECEEVKSHDFECESGAILRVCVASVVTVLSVCGWRVCVW